jgi:CRP/FNR family cyclic AMP-dependent transcriptional regulator
MRSLPPCSLFGGLAGGNPKLLRRNATCSERSNDGGLDDLRVNRVRLPDCIRGSIQERRDFDPQTFLSTVDVGRTLAVFPENQTIFSQGESSDAVFYIQKGRIKLTVLSKSGKEATVGVLSEGDFFGEGCLTGQPLRICSATTMTDCTTLRIHKKSMLEVIHREPAFSDIFVAYLLTRNIRYEADLVDQLFNSSEKRLARVLLLLARFGKDGISEVAIPKISQETLAEMVGTTRGRVNFFMNKFRKLGLVDYRAGDALQIRSSLLNIVLHD